MAKIKRLVIIILVASMVFPANVISLYADTETDLIKYAVGKFKDVKGNDWYAEAVGKLSVMDIVNGLGNGSFNPQGEVTRAQFVKMLVQAMEYKKIDSISFIDMKANSQTKAHWGSVYVETALRNGVIIKSEEGDRFYPDVPISREDMVMMLCRALKLEPSNGVNPYPDLSTPNGYFTKAYEEYLVRGIPVGDKVVFNPTGVTTRAQASVIIARLLEYKADPVAFKNKFVEEEKKIAERDNGVPERLYEYSYGRNGRTFEECNEEYMEFISYLGETYYKTNGYIYPEIATYGGSDKFLSYQFDVVKQYMDATYNVNYKTVASTFVSRIGDSMGRGKTFTWNRLIKEYEKYKVVSKSEFLTDYDCIYLSPIGETIRGTLRIKLENPTSREYANKLGITVGKWYDIDMSIRISRASVSEYWYIDGNGAIEYLAAPILLNK